jgi:hypothetical protein
MAEITEAGYRLLAEKLGHDSMKRRGAKLRGLANLLRAGIPIEDDDGGIFAVMPFDGGLTKRFLPYEVLERYAKMTKEEIDAS